MAEATQYGVVKQFIERRLSEEEALERLLCHRSTLYRKVSRVVEAIKTIRDERQRFAIAARNLRPLIDDPRG